MKRLIISLFIILLTISIFMTTLGFSQNNQGYENQTNYLQNSEQMQEEQEETEKWGALDEVVIEKVAKEKGKKPGPFIELEGDLLLFVFSLVSGISGFIIGFFARKLFFEKAN